MPFYSNTLSVITESRPIQRAADPKCLLKAGSSVGLHVNAYLRPISDRGALGNSGLIP